MVKKETLPNGLRILTEQLEHLRSCAIGVWVESGSRHEPEELCGISHYLEHMLFKGTETRDAGTLAAQFDAIGGQVNAFTTKEHTCFYCRTLDQYLPQAAELLADMFFHSTFKPEDVDLERGVILEEIGMYEDTPEDLCNENMFGAIYGGTALGRPILGTRDSLKTIDSAALHAYKKQNYTPENTIIAVCGSFSEEQLREIREIFGKMQPGTPPVITETSYNPAFVLQSKDTEQNHLQLAWPGLKLGDKRRFALQAMNNILGGGMASRLFQQVREKHGLCYTIYSFQTGYLGTGVFGVYVALGRETEDKAIGLIRAVIDQFLEQGVTQEELDRTITQLKANLLMGLEGTTARMNGMARNEFLYGRQVEPEELIAGLEAVTREDVLALARELLRPEAMSFSAVGKVRTEEEYRALLGI